MKYLFLVLFYFIVTGGAIAQKNRMGAKEFGQVRDAYGAAKNFSSDIIVYSYSDKEQTKGKLLGKGTIRKAGANYYSKYLGEEMISNDHCAVIIDSTGKEVTYFGDSRGYIKDPFSISKIDSMMKGQDSVTNLGVEAGLQHYVFYNKKGVLTRIDMYTDVQSHFIKKLTYYYAPSTKEYSFNMYKMEIVYNNINTAKVNNTYFSEKKALGFKNGKPYLQSTYKGYKLTIAEKYQPPKK